MPSTEIISRAAPLVHGAARRTIHWVSAGGVAAAFAFVLARELTEEPSLDRILLELHRGIGLLVLAVSLLRFAHRFADPMPAAREADPRLRFAATAVHGVLLVLLLALPVLGWAATNAAGKAVWLLGLLPLPTIVPHDRDLADLLGDIHGATAWVLAGVVALHAGAALWHAIVRRDGTLYAMLPIGRRPDADRA